MAAVNKVILLGNTTRDTELHTTKSGKTVANMRLATNRSVNGAEQSQFHTVVCWDRLAEIVAQYATKGRQVYIEGRLEYRTFQDNEGKDRGAVEIVANDVQFLGGRGKAETPEATAVSSTEEVNLDDVPF